MMPVPYRSLSAVFLLALSSSVAAKTIYVELWGSTVLTDCGSKTLPCASVSLAVSASSNNDRIVVGPGVYTQNLNLNREGLALESLAGPRATIISPSNSGSDLVRVLVSRVRVGKIGKGFTLTGASGNSTTSGLTIVTSDLSRVRVEGNILRNNSIGAEIRGDRHSIRGNTIQDNSHAGIEFYNGDRLSIRDNRATNNNGDGFTFSGITRSTVLGNLAASNSGRGFNFGPLSHDNRINNNASDRNNSTGMQVTTGAGMRLIANLVTGNDSNVSISQQSPPSGPVRSLELKNNLAARATSGSPGFDVQNQQNARISGNTAIDGAGVNQGHGFRFTLGSTTALFNGNNTYDNDSGCGIENLGGPELLYRKHFFGASDGPDPDEDSDTHDAACGNFAANSSHAKKPNPIRVQRAAKL